MVPENPGSLVRLDSGTEERDRASMSAIRGGNPAALQDLMDRYWSRLVGFAARFLGSVDAAEDIVQDVFVRLWDRRLHFDLSGSVRCYLYRAVRNAVCDEACKGQVRARWATLRLSAGLPTTEDPARTLETRELRAVVEEKIDALPARRREVFVFAHLHDLSYRQIAEIMGISVQTVANHLSNALADLRRMLGPYLRDVSDPGTPVPHEGPTPRSSVRIG